ncbi:BTAD domain-containing putative transcriptional regulator [Micromonospora rubida]|uniref:BTAD domain-containing putative transcriptional regulator n=1 Tax=Micromonospora rubida TaxID=2697657 RepID=A0ABW7SJR5_9ACTN
MEFTILGPLRVSANGRELHVGGHRSQRILAMLLLNPNLVVTHDRLAEAGWGDDPPTTVRRQVQNRVAALRTRFARVGGAIDTHDVGYQLRVGPDELDVDVFGRLVEKARREPEPAHAATALRTALALWRGNALAGLTGLTLESEAAGLNERRLSAHADCFDAELATGEHTRLLPELNHLVEAHPHHERFVGQLMIALHRAGRRSEGLNAYRRLHRRLVDDIGIEPGEAVQEIHRAVLNGDLAGAAPSVPPAATTAAGDAVPVPVPRQLPADVAELVGRGAELLRIQRALAVLDGSGPLGIVAIEGAGGIGKSALAIHAAHRAAAAFPDGQLYIDLQGYSEGLHPLAPLEVLARFLRALGVAAEHVPTDVEEAAARFRSEVALRRLLLVLDNAREPAQVIPMLPGSSRCAVLVTSRRTLTSMPGTVHLKLDVLTASAAVQQLAQIAGEARVDAEPDVAADVTRACGYLPLALRIAGARLTARPGWTLRVLADRLADAQRRLDELEVTDMGFRASLAVSHQELSRSEDPCDRAAAEAFGLFSLLDGADISVPVAAWLLDRPEPEAERILERLVDTNLLDTPAYGRYRLHDLLRLYGRELATGSQPVQQRTAALRRVFGGYVATAWNASAVIRPGDWRLSQRDRRKDPDGLDFADACAALDWLEAERSNVVAAVHQAADTGGIPPTVPVQLARALYAFLRLRGHWSQAAEVNRIAGTVARQAGDRRAYANAWNDLGAALGQLGRSSEAIECLLESRAIHRELGNDDGEAHCVQILGDTHQAMGQFDKAEDYYRDSLRTYEKLGNIRGQAMILDSLGPIYRTQGRYRQALKCHRQALAIFEQLGDCHGQAVGLLDLGILHRDTGHHVAALDYLTRCLAIYREIGDRHGEAESLRQLSLLRRLQGHRREALACHEAAQAIFRDLGRPDGEAHDLMMHQVVQRLSERIEPRRCAPATEARDAS